MHIYTKGHTRERFRARLKKKKTFQMTLLNNKMTNQSRRPQNLKLKKKIIKISDNI